MLRLGMATGDVESGDAVGDVQEARRIKRTKKAKSLGIEKIDSAFAG
jgi:hypothetical protein